MPYISPALAITSPNVTHTCRHMCWRAGLSTSPKNPLKYWEKIDVSHYHDLLLRVVSNPTFRPYHAQDVNLTRLTPSMKKSARCFARKIVYDLDRHRPWVVKDPRMLLFTHFWLRQVRHLAAWISLAFTTLEQTPRCV